MPLGLWMYWISIRNPTTIGTKFLKALQHWAYMTSIVTVNFSNWYVNSFYTKHITNTNNIFSIFDDISYKWRTMEEVGGILLPIMEVEKIIIKVDLGDHFDTFTLRTDLFSFQRAG
jgi:hypothetical protein